jgi:hypothetical protein
MGSPEEGATSTRLVRTITTDWLTLRKASRSCCAFVVIDVAENVSKLSKEMNADLVFMNGGMRNNCSKRKPVVTKPI